MEDIKVPDFIADLEISSTQIARELRLRDIGGIIVVDFIDMTDDCKILALTQVELMMSCKWISMIVYLFYRSSLDLHSNLLILDYVIKFYIVY